MTRYEGELRDAWKRHLARRSPSAPTVISTFAGCGGSSLGYSMAGFRELLAVEIDENAVETFRLNFPKVPVHRGDIAELTIARCLELAGVGPGELDVLDGSPPCQGFSTSGRREIDDPRNELFREFVRLLRGLQPRAFVMENVTGLVKGKMRLVFAEILRELKASGYRVSARLMNAMYFGVPQRRERTIFVGVREDLGIQPSHPAPMARPIVAMEAIRGCRTDALEVEALRQAGREKAAYAAWSRIPLGKSEDCVSERTIGFNAVRVHPARPCNTITKNDSRLGLRGLMHWSERRRFTLAEFKRFASFPDEFRFAGDWKDGVARIGNSVPPLLMHAIATHLRGSALAFRKAA